MSSSGPRSPKAQYWRVDGQYYCELHILEGLQAGDVFLDRISKAKMLEAIITEIDLCKRLGEAELAAAFQAEKDKIEK